MMRPAACAIAICLAVGGCDKDPARSMKIATRPAAVAADSVATLPSAAAPPAEAEIAAPAVRPPAVPGASVAIPPTSSKVPVADPPATKASSSTKSTPKVKIATGRKVAASTDPVPAEQRATGPSPSPEWRPPGCPIPKEGGKGPSSITVTGPCAFQHQGKFVCEPLADDLYISMTRKAAQGSTLMLYINVERYHGAGEYKAAQMWIAVQGKKEIYRWSSDEVSLTIGPNQAFVVLPTTRLEAEPLLVDCTGRLDNYQCGGRGDLQELIATASVVAGTMHCEAGAIGK
jgi:hypothetical protein